MKTRHAVAFVFLLLGLVGLPPRAQASLIASSPATNPTIDV